MLQFLALSGKADRFEWWTVSLVADLVAQLALVFGLIVAASDFWYRIPAAGALYFCAAISLWAALAVSVRRIRDRGRPPWWLVFALVPVVGWIWLVVECGVLAAPGSRIRKKLLRRIVIAPASKE